MVGLEVVVHGDLPVAVPVLVVYAAERAHVCEAMRGELGGDAPPDLFQWPRSAGETHEHEAEQHLRAHRLQCELRTVQGRRRYARRHAGEPAPVLVRPPGIREGDGARGVAPALQDGRALAAAESMHYPTPTLP